MSDHNAKKMPGPLCSFWITIRKQEEKMKLLVLLKKIKYIQEADENERVCALDNFECSEAPCAASLSSLTVMSSFLFIFVFVFPSQSLSHVPSLHARIFAQRRESHPFQYPLHLPGLNRKSLV